MMLTTVGAQALDTRRSWLALFSLVPASLAIGLDATVVSIALPTLATQMHASASTLQWFVIAYTLAFAAAMIPAGLLGDRWGRKRTLLVALALFGVASAACAWAPGSGAFLAARVLLGLGAAAVTPMSLALLPSLFSPAVRPRALAVLMATAMLGFPLGPLLGGWILSHAWWGWAFALNLPMVAIALVTVGRLMPEQRAERGSARVDVVGILTSSVALTAFTYGATRAGDDGWGSALAWTWMLGGLAVGAGFVAWERRAAHPLVDLRLFRDRGFSTGTALASVLSFVMFGLMFAVPQFAQGVLGTDAQGAGVRFLPLIGGMLVTSLAGDRIAPRLGARVVVGTGLLVTAAALALGATTSVTSGDGHLALWTALAGAGLGLALPASIDAAMAALGDEGAGTGSAVIQALRMVASSLGAAVLGSVMTAQYRGQLPALDGLPREAAAAARSGLQGALAVAQQAGLPDLAAAARTAFTSGLAVMLGSAAVVAALGATLAVLLPGRRAARRPERATPSPLPAAAESDA